ncbi:MAG: chemotaxis protein CheW [Mariprofundaceae bacterium]|nr:chemotaxis protein CheW [Mariprofundaceae bacterium]
MTQALTPITDATTQSATELLTCRVGQQWIGFRVQQVREVVSQQQRTVMPMAPMAVAGLINLRGKVITELDIRRVVGLEQRPTDADFHVAIVETSSGEDFGLVVDDVGEVVVMNEDLFEATPRSLDEVWRQVSDGVLKQQDRVLVLVNVDRFIALTIPNLNPQDNHDITLH